MRATITSLRIASARAGAVSSIRFQKLFTRMPAISPTPSRKQYVNRATAEAGWDGGRE